MEMEMDTCVASMHSAAPGTPSQTESSLLGETKPDTLEVRERKTETGLPRDVPG